MKLNENIYAAVIDNDILEHHEGLVIGDSKHYVKLEAFGGWASICEWDKSKIRIIKIKIVEQN